MSTLTRREFVTLTSGAMAAGFGSRLFGRGLQRPPLNPVFADVRRNVHTFTARGGTIGWLSNPEALIVVDTQYPDSARLCLDGLKDRAARPVDLVFNTHHHIDHTGGNGVFRAVAKKIVAQAHVPALQKMAAAESTTPADPPVLPDATFDQTWTEHAGDETIAARYYGPGHTGGDAILHFQKADVVHMGDLLWLRRHPRVDRPAGASIQNWAKTLATIAGDMPANTIYIAGHAQDGTPVTAGRQEVVDFGNYFDAVLTTVHDRRRAAAAVRRLSVERAGADAGCGARCRVRRAHGGKVARCGRAA